MDIGVGMRVKPMHSPGNVVRRCPTTCDLLGQMAVVQSIGIETETLCTTVLLHRMSVKDEAA